MAGDSIKFTSTTDMFDHLKSVPSTVTVVGMVKPAEDEAEAFNFALRGCAAWVQVPAAMVERFQPLGKTTCGDHHHDVVRLHLKRPEDGAGRVLADLLTQHQSATQHAHRPGLMAFSADDPSGCGPGYHWDWTVKHCMPDSP